MLLILSYKIQWEIENPWSRGKIVLSTVLQTVVKGCRTLYVIYHNTRTIICSTLGVYAKSKERRTWQINHHLIFQRCLTASVLLMMQAHEWHNIRRSFMSSQHLLLAGSKFKLRKCGLTLHGRAMSPSIFSRYASIELHILSPLSRSAFMSRQIENKILSTNI